VRVVLDASACVEFLLGTALGARVAASLVAAESIHAPELLVSEVISALRGLVRGGVATEAEARLALRDLGRLDVDLVSALALAPAIWARSSGHSSYDAHYVALAAALPATLLTTDAKLAAAASGVGVELVSG